MSIIQSILTGSIELAALPINGSVAFFVAPNTDSLENRIYIIHNNATDGTLSELLYSNKKIESFNNIDYSVSHNISTGRVDIKFSNLIPEEEYIIVLDTSVSNGVLSSSSIINGEGVIVCKNYWLSDVDSIEIETAESFFISGENTYETNIKIKSGTQIDNTTISSRTPYFKNGISIQVNDSPFSNGDKFYFNFTRNTPTYDTIVIKTKNIEVPTSETVISKSKRANELDLINFYENENSQNTIVKSGIKRILKSATSIIIEFDNDIDYQNTVVKIDKMPAFNMLSLLDTDWETSKIKASLKLIGRRMLMIRFSEATDGIEEVIKNV